MLFVIPDILLKRTLNTNKNGHMMSYVITDMYKPITNMACVRSRLWKLHKRVHTTRNASDKVYQLLSRCLWFSPASSTIKTGHHDIIVAEILLKVALNTKNQSIKGRGICTCNNCIWFIGLWEKDWNGRREPQTTGKQLVNFITCVASSVHPFV
jgi:hypothetical protein